MLVTTRCTVSQEHFENDLFQTPKGAGDRTVTCHRKNPVLEEKSVFPASSLRAVLVLAPSGAWTPFPIQIKTLSGKNFQKP